MIHSIQPVVQFPSTWDQIVSAINMNCLGKKKRMRSAKMGKRPDWKKAIVKLAEGSIELL